MKRPSHLGRAVGEAARADRIVVALGAALCIAACSFSVAEDTEDRAGYAPFSGTATWTVQGVVPGETRSEIEARLGAGVRDVDGADGTIVSWPRQRGLRIGFDRADVAQRVYGDALLAGETTLVASGMTPAQVRHVLGPGEHIVHRRPKGGGIIAFTSVYAGEEFIHVRDGFRYVVFFNDSGSIGSISAERAAPEHPNAAP